MKYPSVIGEFETIAKLREGFSVARGADGEAKLIDGKGYRREEPNPKLAKELRESLNSPKPTCLPAIPTMDPKGNKYESWVRHYDRFARLFTAEVPYYSAFITRPDSAQWIMVREYAESVQALWAGKSVTIVCEPDNSMYGVVRMAARKVTHIECPSHGAYAQIDHFERSVLKSKPDIAILCVGPTATCLANRLSDRVQTLDMGSSGGFLRKLLTGRFGPMTIPAEDVQLIEQVRF